MARLEAAAPDERTALKTSGEFAGSGTGGREATRDLAEERARLSLEIRAPAAVDDDDAFFVGVFVAGVVGLRGGADCFVWGSEFWWGVKFFVCVGRETMLTAIHCCLSRGRHHRLSSHK